MLRTGEKAPDFSAEDQNGGRHRFGDLLICGPVILYFYPADFTPICTAEACAFRDRFEDLDTAGVTIVGISPQDADSHRRFASTYNLPFPLLADPRKQIIRDYGVDGPLGFGVRRATFLIEADGLIADRVVSDLFVGSHLDLIKKTLGNLEQKRAP